MTENTDLNAKNLTLSDIALQFDKDQINESQMQELIKETPITHCWHSYETPGKMIYEGNPKNSIYSIDRLCGEGVLSKTAWGKIREFLKELYPPAKTVKTS